MTFGTQSFGGCGPAKHSRARGAARRSILEGLRKKWRAEGDAIIDPVATNNPEKILETTVRSLPKEVAVSVEQRTPGNLDPEAWAMLRRLLDLIEACNVDGDPQAVFAAIEEDLSADSVSIEPSISERR